LFNYTFTKTGKKVLKEENAVARANQKMQNEGNAFNNDFRKCMLGQWEKDGILDKLPADLCNSSYNSSYNYSQLCYGLNATRPTAQFISCYNTEALIPEFTAHIVPAGARPANQSKYKRDRWREDKGPYGMSAALCLT
jgi:hypothetical protein